MGIFILVKKILENKIISAFLLFTLAFILWPFLLMPIRQAILISLACLILYIAIIELLFRIFYRLKFKKKYEFFSRVPYKKMIFQPHPYLPYVHKKNFPLYYKERPIGYPLNRDKGYVFGGLTSNNLGLFNGPRGDREIVIPKPKGMVRINCLGASTTGNYIFSDNKPYSYPLELEKVLKESCPESDIEVNNCGVGGYTSADILVKFLLDLIDTAPDVVVIYHSYNDLQPSLTDGFKSDYSHSRRNLGEVYYLYELASKIPNLPLAFWNFIFCNYLLFTQDIGFTVIEAVTKERADISNDFKGLDTYRRNIEHIINICKSNNIQVILSTYCHYLYPAIRDDRIHLKYRNGVEKENEVIRILANKHKLPLVENDLLVPAEEKYFLDSVHFTPEGMHLLARNISVPIIDYLKRINHE